MNQLVMDRPVRQARPVRDARPRREGAGRRRGASVAAPGTPMREHELRAVVAVAAAVVAVLALAELIWQDGHPDRYRALHELLPVSRVGTMTAVASIAVFLLAVGLGARLRPGPRVTGVLRRLSDATFGVFLVHLLILEVIRQSVPEVMAASSFGVLVAAYGVVLVAAFAVSLAAARVRFLRAIF